MICPECKSPMMEKKTLIKNIIRVNCISRCFTGIYDTEKKSYVSTTKFPKKKAMTIVEEALVLLVVFIVVVVVVNLIF